MRRFLTITTSAVLLCTVACNRIAVVDPLKYVDPLIATCSTLDANFWGDMPQTPHANAGCTPGVLSPFGMVNLGPVTKHSNYTSSGYDAHDTTITGFSFMRMSGTGWCAEFGNLLTTATTGPLKTAFGLDDGSFPGYRSRFSKESVTACPGYYSVELEDYGILAECTASEHCGILRFTFPESDLSRIQSDLAFRITGSSDFQEISIVDDHSFEGHMKYTPKTAGWGNGDAGIRYDLYFFARLDRPLGNYGFWKAAVPEGMVRKDETVNTKEYQQLLSEAEVIRGTSSAEGTCIGFFSEFPTRKGEQVELKVGFSFVDAAGARNNFAEEVERASFDDIVAQTRR